MLAEAQGKDRNGALRNSGFVNDRRYRDEEGANETERQDMDYYSSSLTKFGREWIAALY